MQDVFDREFEDISTKKEAPLLSPKKERKYGDSDTDAFANEFVDIGKPSLWERTKGVIKPFLSPIAPEEWGGRGERELAPRETIIPEGGKPDQYGYILGHTVERKGKTYKYIGNDKWQEQSVSQAKKDLGIQKKWTEGELRNDLKAHGMGKKEINEYIERAKEAGKL